MTNTTQNDAVNHPSHYTQYPVEVIELTRHMTFTRGNTVKYVARAGYKGGPEKELEDLKKARWYLDDDIAQLEQKLSEKRLIIDGEIDASKIKNENITINIMPTYDPKEDIAQAANEALFNRLAAQG